MELSADKTRVVGKLDDLDKTVIGTNAAENHPLFLKLRLEGIVHFVAVPVASRI